MTTREQLEYRFAATQSTAASRRAAAHAGSDDQRRGLGPVSVGDMLHLFARHGRHARRVTLRDRLASTFGRTS